MTSDGAESALYRCGFKLIWMRPLLSVVLMPSMPMKEERLSTAGSCRITLARACWRFAMAANETCSAGLRNTEDDARVLHREEALGNVHEEKDGGDECGDSD